MLQALALRLKNQAQRLRNLLTLTTHCVAEESAKDLVCPRAAPRRPRRRSGRVPQNQFKERILNPPSVTQRSRRPQRISNG